MSTQWWGFTALHIVDLNYKTFHQIASLFDRYIDMGQRIPWKQYGLIIVTIAGAPWARLHGQNVITKKKLFHIVTTYEKLVVNYFLLLYICLHLDEVCIFWDFGTLGFGVRPPGLPITISRQQPHKSIKGINGTPQHFLYYASRPQEYFKNISSQGRYMYKNDKWTTNISYIYHIWITLWKKIKIKNIYIYS